ncbi:unnamed protein product [Euphydryas editha]|uniref:Uncharacterized protein n=1 Tax=Euphydryas editha TaxID=104508 RepID=A0AAU9U2I6_EUPED|nr:unnamed protein product [Euphydryas editha]
MIPNDDDDDDDDDDDNDDDDDDDDDEDDDDDIYILRASAFCFRITVSLRLKTSIFTRNEEERRRLEMRFIWTSGSFFTRFQNSPRDLLKIGYLLILYNMIQLTHCDAGTQFASHVSFNSPARSFTHGVGDPIPVLERRAYQRHQNPPLKRLRRPISQTQVGYPRQKPAIPFQAEELPHGHNVGTPWQLNDHMGIPIQVLPPSPYKVDSPDPESLWPIGLFLPPLIPLNHGSLRRSDKEETDDKKNEDPYLLEGSEAIAAVVKSTRHGHLYFHDIPHINSLIANQELRIKNNLKPHRIASIRKTWPYYRP